KNGTYPRKVPPKRVFSELDSAPLSYFAREPVKSPFGERFARKALENLSGSALGYVAKHLRGWLSAKRSSNENSQDQKSLVVEFSVFAEQLRPAVEICQLLEDNENMPKKLGQI